MKSMYKIVAIMLFAHILCAAVSSAEVRCVDAAGEAVIRNNDVSSAKEEAITRAKWNAIQSVTDVEIKGERIVQNMRIVDEAVIKKFHGVITRHKVLNMEERGETIRVFLNICVESSRAKHAMSSLSLNNSLVLFIPAMKPKWYSAGPEYEEANLFTEGLTEKLTEYGYKVYDPVLMLGVDAREMENALMSGNFLSFRSIMYRFLSNVLIIGKIDYSLATQKGDDIGYRLTMPFNHVKAKLIYRIVKRDDSGRITILAAGTEQGKGFAPATPDAVSDSLKDLVENTSPVIAGKLQRHIAGVSKKILLKIENITDLTTNFEVKGILQNIAWVAGVEEKGLGEFMVSYPENIVYLANGLVQKGAFQLIDFSTTSIRVLYKQ